MELTQSYTAKKVTAESRESDGGIGKFLQVITRCASHGHLKNVEGAGRAGFWKQPAAEAWQQNSESSCGACWDEFLNHGRHIETLIKRAHMVEIRKCK
jgi:hypothetical protein